MDIMTAFEAVVPGSNPGEGAIGENLYPVTEPCSPASPSEAGRASAGPQGAQSKFFFINAYAISSF